MNATYPPQQTIVVKSGCGKAAMIIAVIVGVIALGVGGCALIGLATCGRVVDETRKAIDASAKESAKKAVARRNAAAHLQIISFQWRKAQFGSAIEADFGVRNTGTEPLKDFEITCEGLAPSGTVVETRTSTLMERIEPGQTRQFKGVNLGYFSPQSAQAQATITAAVPVDAAK